MINYTCSLYRNKKRVYFIIYLCVCVWKFKNTHKEREGESKVTRVGVVKLVDMYPVHTIHY